eukprot:CAMPEP_0197248148 /NCGR_PEP_ID=MMETSP1429-20130617/35024_1 /TAXON_ID=49237 /ORGANISM="Chaetoceros  sp., Strain UNC1202" /LENGTH=145 /DNA_ID=CAMNT_0042709253 /DNA_START=12 /DNA_END=449 /DNA_ORIENTATION=+
MTECMSFVGLTPTQKWAVRSMGWTAIEWMAYPLDPRCPTEPPVVDEEDEPEEFPIEDIAAEAKLAATIDEVEGTLDKVKETINEVVEIAEEEIDILSTEDQFIDLTVENVGEIMEELQGILERAEDMMENLQDMILDVTDPPGRN